MWLAFILLPCNHLVPEETHKLILNHATTRQQTDRAVGLWQHIYHPPVIADTNCTALSSLLPVTQSSQGNTWNTGFGSSQQWEFMAHPACGPSCMQALCVPPKSLLAPACATVSLCVTYGNKPPWAGENHSKAQILSWIFTNFRNTRGHIPVRAFHACAWKENYKCTAYADPDGVGTAEDRGLAVKGCPFLAPSPRPAAAGNKPACSNRENFVPNILATKAIFFIVKCFSQ